MNDFDFIQISAKDIHEFIIENLENEIGETLYPGDERRIFADALSVVIVMLFNKVNDACRQKLLRFARGEVLDGYGDMNDTERRKGQKASTRMEFSLSESIEFDIIIPKDTRVTNDFEHYFKTTEEAKIAAGKTAVTVTAEAESIGEGYNGYQPGTINILVDQIPYVDSVKNITESSNGEDNEDDETYRERIRRRRAAFSTTGPRKAYKYHTLNADPSIIDAQVYSDTPGCVTVMPICEGGEIPTEDLLERVSMALNNELIRPLTDKVSVIAPAQITYDIELTYYTNAKDESKCVEAVEGPDGAIDRYIKWQQAELGKAINPDKLRKFILCPDWNDLLVGADRVNLISPSYQEIEKTEVARIGRITVNHIVEG